MLGFGDYRSLLDTKGSIYESVVGIFGEVQVDNAVRVAEAKKTHDQIQCEPWGTRCSEPSSTTRKRTERGLCRPENCRRHDIQRLAVHTVPNAPVAFIVARY